VAKTPQIATGAIARCIIVLRGTRVLLDRDLAALYQVRPTALRQQVKRNSTRFPPDFMFRLSAEEVGQLVSQSVIASRRNLGGSAPYAFTEQGVAMLSSVLSSARAVAVNIAIMRTFVAVRAWLANNQDLAARLADLERRIASHDSTIESLFEAIRQLMTVPAATNRPIGFTAQFDPEKE
jgi:hypothetical protein